MNKPKPRYVFTRNWRQYMEGDEPHPDMQEGVLQTLVVRGVLVEIKPDKSMKGRKAVRTKDVTDGG